MAAWLITGFDLALAPASDSLARARAILEEGILDKSPEEREQAALALALSGERQRSLPLLAGLVNASRAAHP